ncbi:helix-turn-helix domain-containing protein [Streptomyces crystallinus]|uniref:Helix-turn-helix domain-containing protein n=1 Tax=Streptomyces crystallinus TaxID=68191 RepID=A0ABP3RHI4_9ACTN
MSTDVLASRLKDMEREELATRRKLPPPAAATVYELTARGRELLPVLTALAAWGAPDLAERRPTDAVRAHWFAIPLIPLLGRLPYGPAVLDVRLDEGEFHVRTGGDGSVDDGGTVYGEGPAPDADARLVLDADTCRALAEGALTIEEGVKDGRIEVTGEGPVAAALRGE